MAKKREKVGVLGAGAWGTAIAIQIATFGETILWAHESETAANINKYLENKVFLPDIPLPKNIMAHTEFAALSDCEIVFFVPPAQFFRKIATAVKPHLHPNAILVICSKGIEIEHEGRPSGALMSEILAEILPDHAYAVMSGPSFASETARGLPTALTLASRPPQVAERLSAQFSQPHFRLYPSDDPIGVQMSGAIKNVLAIACGIAQGRQLGQNAIAALIARGSAEAAALVKKMGGQPKTVFGLSGIGDIVLTCTSTRSRNMSLGVALGRGERLREILAKRQSVSEGVWTAAALRMLAEKHGIIMPICFTIDDILNKDISIETAIKNLLLREIPAEEL